MNKNKILLLALAVVLVGAMLVMIMFNENHDWRMSYKPDNEEPYGVDVLSQIFEETGDYEIISDTIYNQLDENASGNYVFVGRTVYLDSLELDFLMRFVERGGRAYIASSQQNYKLMDTLFSVPTFSNEYYTNNRRATRYQHFLRSVNDTLITGTLEIEDTTNYHWQHVYNQKVVPHYWNYFNNEIYSSDPSEELTLKGFFEDSEYGEFNINFISRPYGEGVFNFHSNPEVFTNYYLLDENNFRYAQHFFGDMKEGTVYFDENNQNYQYTGPSSSSSASPENEGPLSFIMTQPALRWAWYLLLSGGLLYLIFGSKRRQRVIPVLEPNNNTSIEFAETVSQLYIRQKDHRKICMTKMKLFLAFIRERYGLSTKTNNKQETELLIRRIANLSEVDQKHVEKIFQSDKDIIKAYEVTNKMLVDFHHLVEHFYQNCK